MSSTANSATSIHNKYRSAEFIDMETSKDESNIFFVFFDSSTSSQPIIVVLDRTTNRFTREIVLSGVLGTPYSLCAAPRDTSNNETMFLIIYIERFGRKILHWYKGQPTTGTFSDITVTTVKMRDLPLTCITACGTKVAVLDRKQYELHMYKDDGTQTYHRYSLPKTGKPVSMTFARDCLHILKESEESGSMCIDMERVEFGAKGLVVRSKQTTGDVNLGYPSLRQQKGPLSEEDVAIFVGLDAHGQVLPWCLDFTNRKWTASENPAKLPPGEVIASSAQSGSIHLKVKGDQLVWRGGFFDYQKVFSRGLSNMLLTSNPPSPQAPRPENVTYRKMIDDAIKTHPSKSPKIQYIIDHISQKYDVDSSRSKRFVREGLQKGVREKHYKATPDDGTFNARFSLESSV